MVGGPEISATPQAAASAASGMARTVASRGAEASGSSSRGGAVRKMAGETHEHINWYLWIFNGSLMDL